MFWREEKKQEDLKQQKRGRLRAVDLYLDEFSEEELGKAHGDGERSGRTEALGSVAAALML